MQNNIFFLIFFIPLFLLAGEPGWQLETSDRTKYTGIVLSNGQLGIVPTEKIFGIDQVVLNGIYDIDPHQQVSRIVKGMNFGNLKMAIDGVELNDSNIRNWSQTLNMKEASLTTSFNYADKTRISYTLYALRNIPDAGYIDVSVEALKPVQVKVWGKLSVPAEEYQVPNQRYEVLYDLETSMPILQSTAKTRSKNHTVSTSATFIWHSINSSREKERPQLHHTIEGSNIHSLSFEKSLSGNQKLEFAWTAAQCSSQHFSDPKSESERIVINNLLTKNSNLLGAHKKRWDKLWEGDIIVEGNPADQLSIRLALYHLYAFGRDDNDLSIAPMGLSTQVPYNGHIFWDAEIWMFPPLLIFNNGIARSMVNYRYNRLEAAKAKAKTYGYAGAMFPWESDDTGNESTPPFALTGTFEHHISADVAIACWNYYCVTKDKHWLQEKGFPVLSAVADFWVSRSEKNVDGTYSINNVVGANEFLANVDDNAFTNGAARAALSIASNAAKVLKKEANPMWKTVSQQLVIHRFADGTTRENKTYNGERIKQADVNLLAFPLEQITLPSEIRRDLEYYEPRIAPEGPAMGKSIFAVLYARLGDPEQAYRLFKESFVPNQHGPFGSLSETATQKHTYFATGAGGMLQTVLFGFAGLHFTDKGIVQQETCLPREWKRLVIKGVGKEKKTIVIE